MDQLKQFLAFVKKQHFWILCGLAVLLGLIMYAVSGSNMAAIYLQGKGKISNIDKNLDPLVVGSEHPNREWSEQVQKKTEDLRANVRDAWEILYNDQKKRVFVWPAALGADFLAAFNQPTVNTDPRKMNPLCERYQEFIKTELRHLGQIVDAEWVENNGDDAPHRRPFSSREPEALGQSATSRKIYNVYWDAEDEARLMLDYDWVDAPTPQDVRYAQEEIWVLDALCHSIARTNVGARGPYEAAVREINKIQVGYDAVDKYPLGEGANRVKRLNRNVPTAAATPANPAVAGDPRGAMSMEAPKRPARHKAANSDDDSGPHGGMSRMRGGPGMGPPAGMMAPSGLPGASAAAHSPAPDNDPDAWLKKDRYVGPNGRPLSAKDLQAPPVAEYNLMAFRLVLSVDEVRWEKLLLEFCNSPLPLEVREVRINVSDDKDAPDRGMSRRPMAMRSGEGEQGVQHNMSVEIRGVAYLINPPNFEKLGLTANNGNSTGALGANPAPGTAPAGGAAPAAGTAPTNPAGTGASATAPAASGGAIPGVVPATPGSGPGVVTPGSTDAGPTAPTVTPTTPSPGTPTSPDAATPPDTAPVVPSSTGKAPPAIGTSTVPGNNATVPSRTPGKAPDGAAVPASSTPAGPAPGGAAPAAPTPPAK